MNQYDLFSSEVLNPVGQVALRSLDQQQQSCGNCKLALGRIRVVPGEGNPEGPLVMFVGEGPGETEDRLGRPFIGPSGKLLDRMIKAMGLAREDLYLTTVVGCRPPGNRCPEPDEIKACLAYLEARIAAVRPKCLVTLGVTATHALLQTDKPLTILRNRWYEYRRIPLRCTFHPAFLLRPQHALHKKHAWEDLQEVLKKVRNGKAK